MTGSILVVFSLFSVAEVSGMIFSNYLSGKFDAKMVTSVSIGLICTLSMVI